jgi:8-oxo-dGTP pyrophosphatase MutT (NUDIX family)
MLRFEPGREPTVPKPAATVVVVRQDPDAVRWFCVKRHAKSGFLGGALVFPGGKVSDSDRDPAWEPLVTPLSERALSVADDLVSARAFAIAALRELVEEAALLPTVGAALDEAGVEDFRRALAERGKALGDESRALRELLVARGLRLDVSRFESLSRWVTPKAEERRYDTRFYVLEAPAGQPGRHDEHETTHSFWASSDELLAMWRSNEVFLAPPTLHTLLFLQPAANVDDVLSRARGHSLSVLCPEFVMDGEVGILTLPGDRLYPEKHPPPSDPDAPTRFVMTDGRFLPERVEA